MKVTKESKGITLVALVITIIVMLILTGAVVSMLFGENGLITRTGEATNKWNEAEQNEKEGINSLLNRIDEQTSETETNVKEYLDNVPIPKGFYYVGGTKDTGVIISDDKADENKGDSHEVATTLVGNQFVWIPVSNIDEMYDSTNKRGILYTFSGTTSTAVTTYGDPQIVDADGTKGDPIGITGSVLQTELDKMIASVMKYKGFYIGRYETSGKTGALTVRQGYDVMTSETWYSFYKPQKDMYAGNAYVESSMIWGCQWDAVMRWMQTSSDKDVATYVTDSSGKGNYSGSQQVSGSNEDYKVNNIYDMAGNVLDWTLEGMEELRIGRGRD